MNNSASKSLLPFSETGITDCPVLEKKKFAPFFCLAQHELRGNSLEIKRITPAYCSNRSKKRSRHRLFICKFAIFPSFEIYGSCLPENLWRCMSCLHFICTVTLNVCFA